jgi:hypothetical protein
MNSGMMPSWVGTAIVPITKASSPWRPRNRSLAKENPASVAKKTTETDVITATITELRTACQNRMSEVTTRTKFSIR